MSQRFFVAEHDGKIFSGTTGGGNCTHVVLRDIGAKNAWSGSMHPSRTAAEADARREPGPFDGGFVAVIELREVTQEEAIEIGSKYTASPETYDRAFKR